MSVWIKKVFSYLSVCGLKQISNRIFPSFFRLMPLFLLWAYQGRSSDLEDDRGDEFLLFGFPIFWKHSFSRRWF